MDRRRGGVRGGRYGCRVRHHTAGAHRPAGTRDRVRRALELPGDRQAAAAVRQPGPFAEVNKAAAHHADLRALVLPAPEGAKADKALRGEDGWLATKDFLAEFASKEDRKAAGQVLTDHGLRHVAARGWTTRDGTHTRIYLLRFGTAAVADELFATELIHYDSPTYAVRGAEEFDRDEDFPEKTEFAHVTRSPYAETKPYGAEQVRQAYLSAGDTVALIVQFRKGTAEAVPFQQTVVLQSQLLS